MENKKAAILVLAIVAAVMIAAGGAYAMTGRGIASYANSYPSTVHWSGMGPSMMGGSAGYRGGMMGAGYGQSSMMEDMQQYMWHYWNSTSVP